MSFLRSRPASPPSSRREVARQRRETWTNDTDAQISLSTPMSILAAVITAIVGIAVLAAVMPTWFTNVADITGTFNDANTTTGDTTADGLLSTFGLITAFTGLFAIVGLVFLVMKLRGSKA